MNPAPSWIKATAGLYVGQIIIIFDWPHVGLQWPFWYSTFTIDL